LRYLEILTPRNITVVKNYSNNSLTTKTFHKKGLLKIGLLKFTNLD